MPTKTDRILSYLPGTFLALPRPTALFSVVDAFGGELLNAENSLAAIMAAHWVDHADRGGELIADLGHIAALYGLAPRPDETVEEFRDHLKRYIRIFLEGPSTVQGILRITAEALGLRIQDDYAAMDMWWMQRGSAPLVTIERRGEDAAQLLFGVVGKVVTGEPARAASLTGTEDLSSGADLLDASVLRVAVDGGAPVDIDLAAQAATLEQITSAINDKLGLPVASDDGRFLMLTSPTTGAASRLEIGEPTGDAAPRLLGLLPRLYHGEAAAAAEVSGVALDGPVELTENRYLRLLVDGKHLAEIDCGGRNPGGRTIDQIRDAINDALGLALASNNGHHLKLTSPTVGFGSSIAFQTAAAQDARERLFGGIGTFHAGRDDQRAVATGVNDLSRGVDLSARSKVCIRLDDRAAASVECAGADPARTLLSEIVAALNAALGQGVASHDGRFIRLASPASGPTSLVAFEILPVHEDAADVIFGIEQRTLEGADATSARIIGTPDLRNDDSPPKIKVDFGAIHILRLAVDGQESVDVDVASLASNVRAVTATEIRDAIKNAVGVDVASDDGQHLILTSATTGAASRIAIETLAIKRRRRFVTRAFTTNEAAQAAFGFLSREAKGVAATQARVAGEPDLSRGVDLREARLLRLTIDRRLAVEIDCAGQRPRATLIGEVINKINLGLDIEVGDRMANGTLVVGKTYKIVNYVSGDDLTNVGASSNTTGSGFAATGSTPTDWSHGSTLQQLIAVAASPDGKKLALTSPSSGATSRVAFDPPRAGLDVLFGVGPGSFRGRDATRVTFVGTVDLSAGIDLSAASKVKIGIDGEEHEIDCANSADPVHTALNNIIVAIDLAFGGKPVVRGDGAHVVLISQTDGENSRIGFATASAGDATKLIFGIPAPRTYHGFNALPAQVVGAKSLPASIDVSAARFLRVAVNAGEPLDVDCSAGAPDASQRSLADIVAAINAAFSGAGTPAIATEDGGRLVIATTTVGAVARLDLLPHAPSDARSKLFGDVRDETVGADPAPAVITGTADLLVPIDLSERHIVRLSVDSGAPVEVDIAGAAPSTTSLDEIVARIKAVFPNLASATDDDRLRLTSPTRGENSRLELQPLRVLELIDYPPTSTADPPADNPLRSIRPGDRWSVANDGAADASIEVELHAPHGAVGTQLVNHTIGQRIRIMEVVRPGEQLKLWFDDEVGLRASVIGTDGSVRPVADSHIRLFSIGPEVTAHSQPLNARLAAVLTLPRGRSDWSYTDCHSSRFNYDNFDAAQFAGETCTERGVFDVSRFRQDSPESEIAVFSSSPPSSDPPVEIRFRWFSDQPGAFVVNLPADLPERFGGRFNLARFAHAGEKPDEGEQFDGVVTEPDSDPDYLKTRINTGPNPSKLVRAEVVARAPIGFEAATMPFRKPRSLTLGTETEPAKIYLAEKDVSGFIELSARSAGSWGNSIQIVARKAGAALFDVTISFPGARFENARLVAMGSEHLPLSVEDLLKPGPMGILQAKAAGIRATVTRDRVSVIS